MDQYKQTPKPDYLFFRKFISYLAITAPIGLLRNLFGRTFIWICSHGRRAAASR